MVLCYNCIHYKKPENKHIPYFYCGAYNDIYEIEVADYDGYCEEYVPMDGYDPRE